MILILYQLDYKIATYVYFNLDLKNVLHLRDGSPYMKNVNERYGWKHKIFILKIWRNEGWLEMLEGT